MKIEIDLRLWTWLVAQATLLAEFLGRADEFTSALDENMNQYMGPSDDTD